MQNAEDLEKEFKVFFPPPWSWKRFQRMEDRNLGSIIHPSLSLWAFKSSDLPLMTPNSKMGVTECKITLSMAVIPHKASADNEWLHLEAEVELYWRNAFFNLLVFS